MKINLYENLSKPFVLKNIEVNKWFNLIHHSDYTTQIITGRINPETLDALKNVLPCVTYNFLYKGYKKDSNRLGSTGIIFIDIDYPNFDISKLDKTCILGYYRSLSGRGYHILVRVDGVTPDNFKATYKYVCNELGISHLKDDRAIKHSQFSVLSYDTDVYYNENAKSYMAVSPSSVISISDNNCIPIVSNIKERKTYTYEGDTKVRFDNLDEINIPLGERYVTNWDGYEHVKCWLPIYKLKDGRKRFLLSYTTNFVWLNPNLDYEKYFLILGNVNQTVFEVPLPPDRIKDTLNTVVKQLREGKLKPINYWNKRKIVFNPMMKFDKGEKLNIVIQELAIRKTNQSIDKLRIIIENWDDNLGKLTARNIFKASQTNKIPYKFSYKTICKYYKHLKDEIVKKNTKTEAPIEFSTETQKSFEFTLGGLYRFEDDINTDGFYDYYPQMDYQIDFKHFVGIYIESLKTRMLSINLNDSTGRKELYESVQEICKMDSQLDFDALYMDMFKFYHNRKLSA